MGMSVGGKGGGLNNEPNVVPMIDVLLVLLIIFMVMQPMSRKAIDLQLPDPTPSVAPANAVSNQIVLEVLPGDQYAINKEPVTKDGLLARLKSIYDPRPGQDHVREGRSEGEVSVGDLRHGPGARGRRQGHRRHAEGRRRRRAAVSARGSDGQAHGGRPLRGCPPLSCVIQCSARLRHARLGGRLPRERRAAQALTHRTCTDSALSRPLAVNPFLSGGRIT